MEPAHRPLTATAAILAVLTAFLGGTGRAAAVPVKVTPPALDVLDRQLGNGLRVLMLEDHTVPLVSVQVWYHVGAKNEPRGRSGFAHLFEHLMFKGSAHVAPEEHSHFVESIGGRDNATTDWDRTLYYEIVPSNYLERILWMEADRMQTLDVSEANFHSERQVVEEERRLRVDDPPFGKLQEIIFGTAYTTHPYHLLPIGSIADLEAATIADVRQFYKTWYVPNNATLVIAGDLDPARTMKWIEAYFGPIPKGSPLVRQVTREPAQTAARREVAYDPKAPLPAIILNFHVPAASNPDLYPLLVASRILSNGESSRLYRKLVYDKQIAVDIGGDAFRLEDPAIFYFLAVLQRGQKPEAGEAALQEEVDRLRNEPVPAEELEKARNQIVAELVFQRETANDKATAIGNAAVILGDLSLVNHQLDLFQKVTAADIQRVARTYFTPQNRTTVCLLPEAMRPAGARPPSPPGPPAKPPKETGGAARGGAR
jgi:zinc protease